MTNRVAILDEIMELVGGPLPRRDNEITASEFAEEAGIGAAAAYRRLQQAVANGKLGTRLAIANGRRCQVFWKLEE